MGAKVRYPEWEYEVTLLTKGLSGVVLVAHITDKEGVANWISNESRSSKLQIVSKTSDGSVVVIRYFPAHILDGNGSWNVTGAGKKRAT